MGLFPTGLPIGDIISTGAFVRSFWAAVVSLDTEETPLHLGAPHVSELESMFA